MEEMANNCSVTCSAQSDGYLYTHTVAGVNGETCLCYKCGDEIPDEASPIFTDGRYACPVDLLASPTITSSGTYIDKCRALENDTPGALCDDLSRNGGQLVDPAVYSCSGIRCTLRTSIPGGDNETDTTSQTSRFRASLARMGESGLRKSLWSKFNNQVKPEPPKELPEVSYSPSVATNETSQSIPSLQMISSSVPSSISIPTSLQQSTPASLQQSIPTSLQQSIPTSLQQSIPTSLQQSIPASLQQSIPASLQQSIPASLRQSIPTSLQQSIPASLQQSFPSALIPSALQQSIPSALQSTASSLVQNIKPNNAIAQTIAATVSSSSKANRCPCEDQPRASHGYASVPRTQTASQMPTMSLMGLGNNSLTPF